MKFLTVFLFIFSVTSSFSQGILNIYEVSTKSYPQISAKIFGIDTNGKLISGFEKNSLHITENGVHKPIDSIHCIEDRGPQQVYSVLTLDVSESMLGGNLEIAREAALQWIDDMNELQDFCAITTFSEEAQLRIDFSNDKTALRKSLENLDFGSGTNFNAGFLDEKAGAINIAKSAPIRPSIIFLTDGVGIGDVDEILKQAKAANARVYTVSVDIAMPDILKTIANETGGQFFENIKTKEQILEVYRIIRKFTELSAFCEIFWTTDGCFQLRECTITDSKLNLEKNFQYINPFGNFARLEINPTEYLYYYGVKPYFFGDEEVVVTARNEDIEITGVTTSHPYLEFNQWVGRRMPFVLPKDSSVRLQVRYAPTDSNFVFGTYQIESSACLGGKFFGIGGNPNVTINESFIKIIQPNGGERIPATNKSVISWENSIPGERIVVEYSTNAGQNWNTVVDNAIGSAANWTVPNVESDRCLARVSQYARDFGRLIGTFDTDFSTVLSIDWNREGSMLATVCQDSVIRIFHPVNNTSFQIKDEEAAAAPISISWSPDAIRFAIGYDDGTVSIWNLFTREKLRSFKAHSTPVTALDWNINASLLVTASADGKSNLWNAISFELRTALEPHSRRINSVAFSPNGNFILTGSDDSTVNIYSQPLWRLARKVRGHNHSVSSVSWAPNSLRFVTGSLDRYVRVFDIDGKQECSHREHTAGVLAVSWNPFKNMIASTGRDSKILVWDPCKEIRFEFFRNWHQFDLVWSPDGSRLAVGASGSEQNKVALYSVDQFPAQQDVSDNFFSIIKASLFARDLNLGKVRLKRSAVLELRDYFLFTGNIPVSIDSIVISGKDAANFLVQAEELPFVLNVLNQKKIEFNFRPTFVGQHTAEITIYSNLDPITYKLFGEGVSLDLDYYNIDFQQVVVGRSKSIITLVLQNRSTLPLIIDSVKMIGPELQEFKFLSPTNSFVLQMNGQNGSRREMEFSFSPTETKRRQTVVRFYHEADSTDINVYGEGIKPIISELVDIESNNIACSKEQFFDIEISNSGGVGNLVISDLLFLQGAENSEFVDLQLPLIIKPDSNLTIRIRFQSETAGTFPISFQIFTNAFNAVDGFKILNINAEVKDVAVQFDKSEIDFGIVVDNTRQTQLLEVQNIGTTTLKFEDINLKLSDKFEILAFSNNEILPGDFISIQIDFLGAERGETHTADLLLIDNCGNNYSFKLTARVRTDASNISVADSYTFESVICDNKPKLIGEIVVSNIGLEILTITEIDIINGKNSFELESNFPFQIQPLQDASIFVSFINNNVGLHSGSLQIKSDANNLPVVEIELSARREKIKAEFLSDRLEFKFINREYPGDQALTITNVGTYPFNIESFPNSDKIQVLNELETPLNPGESHTFNINYNGLVPIATEIYFIDFRDSCGINTRIPVRILPPGSGSVSLRVGEINTNIGEVFDLPIIIEDSENLVESGAEGIIGTLRFNASLMYPLDYDNNIGFVGGGFREMNISLPLSKMEDNILGTLKFKALWGDDSTTSIELLTPYAYGRNLVALNIETEPGNLRVLDLCDIGGLRLFYVDGVLRLFAHISNVITGEITVNFELIEDGDTKLSFFNLVGEEVIVVFDEFKSKGKYSLRINGGNLPAGVYFYRLTTPSHITTKKILINR